jgi:two-component system response regulator HydG
MEYCRSKVERFSQDAIALLTRSSWPGNIRELENIVERLVIMTTKSTVDPQDLEPHIRRPAEPDPLVALKQKLVTLRQVESEYIAFVIAHCGGNKTRAAEILGVDVSTIHRRERNNS